MACTWLQSLNNSLVDWEQRGPSPSPSESATVLSITRTHVFQVYTILESRYEVLLT